MGRLKVLNCYAGIGGNRKLWKNVDVVAIENNKEIATIYSEYYPKDKVIITDITIIIECGELIKAKIECIPNSIQIQKIEQFLLSDNENKEYQIIPKIKL